MKSMKKILLGTISSLLVALFSVLSIDMAHLPKVIPDCSFDISEKAIVEGELDVMSFNIRCWSPTDMGEKNWFYRAELVMNNISSRMPDVIGFQEIKKAQYGFIKDSLVGYDHVFEYRDNSLFSESCPVFYRTDKYELIDKGSFWLSETPDVASKSWGAAYNRICTYTILKEKSNGKEFVVFNTHLDHVSDEARVNGINVILDKIAGFGGIPAVLMGDLNAGENSRTYEMAMEHFLDTKYIAEETMESATFQNWGESLGRGPIDYIMVSKEGFSAKKYEVVTDTYDGVYPSDHFPVFAKLILN